ncbi:MAG: zf-HC2 domain-containing protein [Isosphaeraceae bacterium]
MAEKNRGVIMNGTTCRWVCERLPLFAEGQDDASGDLDVETRDRIGRHLADCGPCRARHLALADVLSILGAVASDAEVGPDSGSVLEGVNETIRRSREPRRLSWLRPWRASGTSSPSGGARPPIRARSSLRSEYLLQIAWSRDSVREALAELSTRLRAGRMLDPRPLVRSLDLRVGLGVGLAAIALFLFTFVLAGVAHRQRMEAEARVALNAAPIPGMQAPRLDEEFAAGRLASEGSTRMDTGPAIRSAGEPTSIAPDPSTPVALAQASPPRPPAIAGGSGTGSVSSPPRAEATPPAATAGPRYDYDLEHGTPMSPENRGLRQAY